MVTTAPLFHGSAWRVAVFALLSVVGYWPFLSLPLFSDDYIQIQLGRQYGPVDRWQDLARDALYRCRATSILITHWTEQLFGVHDLVLTGTSMLIHLLNTTLVYLAGSWQRIGFRVSFPAACFFAVYQRPQEAVVWYAALPELLVFLFVAAALLSWIAYIQSGRGVWYLCALACYLLALLSKESAVVFAPMALGIVLLDRGLSWRLILRCLPFAVLALLYYAAASSARSTHLHFNDGTFSLSAPFLLTEARSIGRLFWFWGLIAAVFLLVQDSRVHWRGIAGAALWMMVALLPYSFVVYQGSVPSRHTYIASVGIAMLMGRAYIALEKRFAGNLRAVALVAAVCLFYQAGYLWFYKYGQYVDRAAPTVRLLEAVKDYRGPVQLECFPYGPEIAQRALEIRTEGRAWLLPEGSNDSDALRFDGCVASRD